MEDCIFCSIACGEKPGTIIFENDDVCVITPTTQISSEHMLVLPKLHFETIIDIQNS